MTSSNVATHTLSEHDERVHNILSWVGDEFKDAADFLAEHNINKHLAQQVDKLLKEPLSYLHERHVSACNAIAELMRDIVVSHVKTVAEAATVTGFWEVERPDANDNSTMEYTIALREYTLEKRALLRNFKTEYQCTEFAKLAPLVFHLIPEKRVPNVVMSKKIEL